MTPRTAHGMTLIEVLASLLIVAIAIFALMELQGRAIENTLDARTLSRAQAAAETALDEFLAVPHLEAFGDVFQSDEVVDVPGYTEKEFEVHLILSERDPLNEQQTLDVFPDAEAYYPDLLEAAETDESTDEAQEWDPGLFVSVGVEVYEKRPPGRLLVSMETWLPKPYLEEEQEDRSETSGTSTGGSTGGGTRTGRSTGGGRSGGSTGGTRSSPTGGTGSTRGGPAGSGTRSFPSGSSRGTGTGGGTRSSGSTRGTRSGARGSSGGYTSGTRAAPGGGATGR